MTSGNALDLFQPAVGVAIQKGVVDLFLYGVDGFIVAVFLVYHIYKEGFIIRQMEMGPVNTVFPDPGPVEIIKIGGDVQNGRHIFRPDANSTIAEHSRSSQIRTVYLTIRKCGFVYRGLPGCIIFHLVTSLYSPSHQNH